MSRSYSFTLPDPPKARKFGGYEGSPLHFSAAPFFGALAVWFILPVSFLLYKGFISLFMGGFGELHSSFHLFLQRNVWAADGGFLGFSGTFWGVTSILALLAMLAIIFLDDDETSAIEGTAIGVNVLLIVLGLVGFTYSGIYGDRDNANAYTNETTIRVADVNAPPSSLSLLYNQKDAARQTVKENETLKFGNLATVSKGVLPQDVWQWEPRNSSLSGAQKWLNDKTPSRQGVDTWDDTLTYVYGTDATTSRWSVVMDGSGRTRSTLGVAEWKGGETTVHVCAFDAADSKDTADDKADYKFTRAFAGTNANSLRNVISDRYPNLFFNDQDVSGYCDANDKPIITVSMLENISAGVVTTQAPSCLLVLKGSPTGFPDMNCLTDVQPGQFPIQVYPLSIVQQQRDSIDWAAGRGNKDGANFGYEPSSYASQASNTSDYVLRSKTTGRVYAVTPSKFNKTKSQTYVLYQVVPVDTITSGKLNPMDAYVQEDNASAVNPSLLDTNAHIYMGWVLKQNNLVEHIPVTFFSDGGSIQEFVPLTTDLFRGYGVDKTGATRFYIDLSASNKTNPVITVLNIAASAPVVKIEVPSEVREQGNGETLKPSVTIMCDGKNQGSIPPDAVLKCAQAYIDELGKRANK